MATLTDEERAKLATARLARDQARGLLAETRSRSQEIEDLTSWLRRARARNNFSERVQYLMQHPREDPPWRS